MAEFKLPELGENVEEVEVIRLLVSEGDEIEADQNVMEVESDKAATGLPCPIAGKVSKVHVVAGDRIDAGQTLLTIEEAEAPAEEEQPEEKPPQKKEKPKKKPAAKKKDEKKPGQEEREGKEEKGEEEKPPRKEKKEKEPAGREREAASDSPIPAGPATRRMARVMEVDLSKVEGSGRNGRITFEDVKAAAEGHATPLPDFAKWGKVRRERMNQIARKTAENVSRSWKLVPHVTQHDSADITQLEAARQRYNEGKGEDEPKLTMTAFAIKAVVSVLKDFPKFNSSFDPSAREVIVKDYYHIGIAVDTEEGLVVPVMRDADRKRTKTIAQELEDLAQKARDRKLSGEDIQGGTFTITNLGGIGGTNFTPIVNYPEVAILGIGQARWHRDTEDDGEKRLRLPLSLSYDHRVINGADGARFISKVAELLSDPSDFLIES